MFVKHRAICFILCAWSTTLLASSERVLDIHQWNTAKGTGFVCRSA